MGKDIAVIGDQCSPINRRRMFGQGLTQSKVLNEIFII